jgi:hypothetical protein
MGDRLNMALRPTRPTSPDHVQSLKRDQIHLKTRTALTPHHSSLALHQPPPLDTTTQTGPNSAPSQGSDPPSTDAMLLSWAGSVGSARAVSSACAAGRLAPDKTRTVHLDEGFDFLGFTIRRQRKRGTTKHYVYTTPSNKTIQKVKDKGED